MENKPAATIAKIYVTITPIDEGNFRGELTCRSIEEPFHFADITGMIELMEAVFEVNGYPKAHLLPRTFNKVKDRHCMQESDLSALAEKHAAQHKLSEAQGDSNKTSTFEISVRLRHHAEWQGSINWIEKDEEKQFSSIIELIRLINIALGSRENAGREH